MSIIDVRKVREHYEIYIDGQFYCACDDRDEVNEEIANYKNR